MDKIYDVIILGAGPAGLAAGLYAGRSRLSTLIIEKGKDGGQIAITDEIENYPGQQVEGESGPSLIARMTEQAKKFGAERASDTIISVELDGDVKVLKSAKNEYKAKAVIVATGAFPKPIGCENEAKFMGKGISFCATCDASFFEDFEVYVVGGGDSAMEEANFLARFGSSVTLIHRRDEFRASQIMVERTRENPKINLLMNTVVERINGDGKGVTSLDLRNTATNETSKIEANGVFVAIGHVPQTGFLGGQLDLDDHGYIRIDETSTGATRTSVPGVFAAGDCADAIYQQAIVAAGSGCRAALDVQSYLEDIPEGI